MRNSLQAQRVVTAFERGYRVGERGDLLNPSGRAMNPHKRPWPTGGGSYMAFNVRLPGDPYSKPVRVHQLAAFQKFGGAALAEGTVVRHLDNDPHNNALENIGIGTQKQNMYDRPAAERIAHAKKAARRRRKLTDEQAVELRAEHEAGHGYTYLREKYGVSKSTVSYIVNNKTYRKEA